MHSRIPSLSIPPASSDDSHRARKSRPARLCLPQQPEQAVSVITYIHVLLIEPHRPVCIVHSVEPSLTVYSYPPRSVCAAALIGEHIIHFSLRPLLGKALQSHRSAKSEPDTDSLSAGGRGTSVTPGSCPYRLARAASGDADWRRGRAMGSVWTVWSELTIRSTRSPQGRPALRRQGRTVYRWSWPTCPCCHRSPRHTLLISCILAVHGSRHYRYPSRP